MAACRVHPNDAALKSRSSTFCRDQIGTERGITLFVRQRVDGIFLRGLISGIQGAGDRADDGNPRSL